MGGLCCKGPQESKKLKDAIKGKKKVCIWITGGPGSGKGTQCEKLAAKFQLAHLSTGDLLRDIVNENSPLANEIRTTMEQGGLVDTETVLKLLINAMEEVYPKCRGYLIDGYPREVKQGKMFCKLIGPPHLIIYLECSANLLIERLLKRGRDSGRVDDNEETIKNRLETFHGRSKPVIDHWRSKVVPIDASRSPEEVEKDCMKPVQGVINDFRYSLT